MDNLARTYEYDPSKSFPLTGKIMLCAIAILLAAIVFMVCLHIYARLYLVQSRRLRRRQRNHFVFYVDSPSNPLASGVAVSNINRGLDTSVLGSLPVFVYSSKSHQELLECAVCLSEFEENEKGRLLPKCNHSFHIDCIDMWFHSHSTCPICRSPVDVAQSHTSDDVLPVVESEGNHLVLSIDDENGDSTSSNIERKNFNEAGITIEIPGRNVSNNELTLVNSPVGQGFISPGTRLLSLKRILSMGMRSGPSSPAPTASLVPTCRDSLDIECGATELTRLDTAV